jgi:DNA (cytosine-5)-methyltransferase 1
MTRPRLLDLFCGAGGAAMGYHRAGFEVIGVDNREQPHYPFEFIYADALEFLDLAVAQRSTAFAAIHASPPCQRYIRGGLSDKTRHLDLVGPTRALLVEFGIPWVIENVPGAPMRPDVVLCGSMFDLQVRRHRWFECSFPVSPLTPSCDHSRPVAGVYGNAHGASGAWPGMLPGDLETWSRAMGIHWMNAADLSQAIPPAYAEHVGTFLRIHLEDAARERDNALQGGGL